MTNYLITFDYGNQNFSIPYQSYNNITQSDGEQIIKDQISTIIRSFLQENPNIRKKELLPVNISLRTHTGEAIFSCKSLL